jgi:hypothetical protein
MNVRDVANRMLQVFTAPKDPDEKFRESSGN